MELEELMQLRYCNLPNKAPGHSGESPIFGQFEFQDREKKIIALKLLPETKLWLCPSVIQLLMV